MNLGKRSDYNDLIWLAIFQMFQISMKYARLDLTFPHLKASEPSFATISKPLRNKTKELFCEGNKCVSFF